MQRESIEITRERLIHWGDYFDKTQDRSLGYPSQSAMMNANTGSSAPLYQDDPEAWEIEKIMLRMQANCNGKWSQALILVYQKKDSKVTAASKLKVSLATCKNFINCAESWVDGQLALLAEQVA